MTRREINLIGGFYKDSSLPWSAQDTVNWLPVPAQEGGTRSPMKLRGAPGLRPFGGEVIDILRIVGDAPDGIVGTPYSFAYSAEGGTPPYTFSFVSGTLPDGLAFSAGTISGTPTTVETDSYQVRVTDADGRSATRDDSIAITEAEGLWVLFARPPGSIIADQYSVASAIPTSFTGAKRPAVVDGLALSVRVSGAGGGWLFAADVVAGGEASVIRSNDLGATWVSSALNGLTGQQRIDVRGGRVIVAQTSSMQYSDDFGATQTTSSGSALAERYLFNTLEAVGAPRSTSDILQTTDNFANRTTIAGFPEWGSSRNVVNLCAGSTHLVVAGANNSPANRFSRVPIGNPRAAHTPFTVAAVSSSATWINVSPSIAYGNSIFVMVTDQGQIVRSTDEGASWTVASFTFPSPRSLVFGDGVFLICGNAGAIYTSTDGDTWTLRSSGTFGTDDITNAIYIP
jgi:hypothetical protein